MAAFSTVVVPTGAMAAAEVGAAKRQTFRVQPFVNVTKARSLDYLEAGAPVLIAERLGQLVPLRFVGPPSVLGDRPGSSEAKWIVTGQFERRPDWTVAVTVEVRAAGKGDGEGGGAVARETRVGSRDEAAQLTMQAAREAFAALPEVKVPPLPDWMAGAFGRDPYAFVLYGRALAQYHGLSGRARSADRAAEIFKRALVIDPRVPETRRYLGLWHLEGGRPGHARTMWTYVLDVRPRYAMLLAGLAALDQAAGLPEARDRYEKLLEVDPDELPARRAYGEMLAEAGEMERAQEELERVLAASPGDLRARRALALVLASRRAGQELVRDLEEVVKLDSEDLDARMDLGAAYVSVGMLSEAGATYEEVVRRRPRHPAALKLAGDMALQRGDLKRAAAHYDKLHRIAPDDPRPLFILGAAYFEAGDLDAAERRFVEGAQLPGMLGDAYASLGVIALQRGKPKEALWFLRRAAKRRPGTVSVRFNHALALSGANRNADSLNELAAAATLDPDDAGVRFLSGVVSLRLGLVVEAEAHFAEALRLNPDHEGARHNLALLEPFVRPRTERSLSFVEGIRSADGVVRTTGGLIRGTGGVVRASATTPVTSRSGR